MFWFDLVCIDSFLNFCFDVVGTWSLLWIGLVLGEDVNNMVVLLIVESKVVCELAGVLDWVGSCWSCGVDFSEDICESISNSAEKFVDFIWFELVCSLWTNL